MDAASADQQSPLGILSAWPRLQRLASIAVRPEDDDEARLQKVIFVATTVFIVSSTAMLGLIYLFSGEPIAAAIPLGYGAITSAHMVVLARNRDFATFRLTQTAMGSLLPFLMMIWLGGYALGSVVIIWSFLAPILAFLCWGIRPAVWWFGVFVAMNIAAGALTPYLRDDNDLPESVVILLTVMNIVVVTTFAHAALLYFFRQKELALTLAESNRELERAGKEQERLLRQSERLATLGRLSAGVAHELNNPAAAVQRGADQLRRRIRESDRAQFELGAMSCAEEQQGALNELAEHSTSGLDRAALLSPLERSDREAEMERALDAIGVERGWEYAPILVSMGYDEADVARLLGGFDTDDVGTVVSAIGGTHEAHSMLNEIGQGATRISETVQALKSYTFMDQAPLQFVDVHEELEGTIVIMRSKLSTGVEIVRDYEDELPRVEGYGGELNQVWTNLIDNAVEAMDGDGVLSITTRREGASVVVEIADTGPGIPADVQPHIFDPFYTTKTSGKGMGLGLNTTHNIVVEKHGGEILLDSEPGRTTFTVRLPVELPPVDEG